MISILSRRSWFASKLLRMIVCLALPASPFVFGDAYGQIVRDGSLGQTAGPLTGPNFTIDVQNPGAQIRGANLFHSFSDFNVNTGQSATFTGPSNISNIINRVTGANLSNIDGQLNSQISGANFYLMNPNGVVVGPNASFNISGSVYLTTANYIRFGDEGQLFADPSKTSLLTSAPIVSFGFLGNSSPGRIVIDPGSNDLSVPEGKTISLIGRDVSITGRNLTAPNGKVQVASVGSVNEPPPPPDPEPPPPPPDPDCCIESPPADPDCCLSFSPGYGGEPGPVVLVQSDLKKFNPSEPLLADVVSLNSDFQISSPGYGGEPPPTGAEVNLETLNITGGTVGRIAMSPEASLNAGPKGVVQTNPSPENIQTPPGSQKIVRSNLVKVVTAPVLNSIESISPNLTIEEGETTSITISLNKPAEITETVSLSNSNSGAATTVPAGPTVTFAPGQQTQTVQVTGVKQGSTQLSAILRGVTKGTAVTVLQRQGISQNLTQTVELGVSGTLIITLNRTSSTPTEITLNNLTPGVATLNTTKVTISPEQTTSPPIEVKTVTVGTATVRAILGNASVEKSMQVTPMSIASLSGVSILEGQSGTATVTLPRAAPSDVAVTLTTSNSHVATVETSVTVPEGKTSAPVIVFGVTEGTVQLRAQSGNSTQTAAVVVNASPPPPLTSAVTVPLSNPDIAGASQTIELAAAAQYPRVVVVPQATVAMPRLLADRCAGSKDGQFSSFAQLFRDSSPPQPGRYLSSPSILEQDLLSMGRSSTPEISFSIGPPRVLSVSPAATLLAMDACGR
jgi:filamentous hemagglutinin family protein